MPMSRFRLFIIHTHFVTNQIEMMKFTIIVVGAILAINFCDRVFCISNEEMDKISEFCKTQEQATENNVAMWKDDIKPKPRIVKCLDACFGEKLGMLVNNRLNGEAILNNIVNKKTDQKTISNLKAIVNECESMTDQDRCEASAKILDCISVGARKRGMKEIF